MSDSQTHNALDWFDALQQAILALETAESGASLKAAPWWDALMGALESTQTASSQIGIAVLSLLSQTLLETLRPLREGVVELTPGTMKLQSRALRKWESLRDLLASTPADDEVSTLLQSLGSDKKEKAARSAAGRSTLLIADMTKYLPLFVEETEEALETMQSHLLALEADAKAGRIAPQNTIDELFRNAHKIKASAGAMGFLSLSEMTHTLETVLDRVRSFQLRATPEIVSTLLSALDHLRAEVEVAKRGQVPSSELLEVKASLMWYLDTPPAADAGMARAIDTGAANAEHPAEHSLSETAMETVHRAIEEGQSAYRIFLRVSPASPLPELRLFLATVRARTLGAIIAPSVPTEELDQNAGLASLQCVLISKETEEKVRWTLRDEELETLSVEVLRGSSTLAESATATQAPTSVQNVRVFPANSRSARIPFFPFLRSSGLSPWKTPSTISRFWRGKFRALCLSSEWFLFPPFSSAAAESCAMSHKIWAKKWNSSWKARIRRSTRKSSTSLLIRSITCSAMPWTTDWSPLPNAWPRPNRFAGR